MWYEEVCTGCSCQVSGSTEERIISFGSGCSTREGFLGGFPVVKKPHASAGDLRDVGSIPGQEDPLEEGVATHSRMLAWRIPWAGEPGGLQSFGLQSRTRRND